LEQMFQICKVSDAYGMGGASEFQGCEFYFDRQQQYLNELSSTFSDQVVRDGQYFSEDAQVRLSQSERVWREYAKTACTPYNVQQGTIWLALSGECSWNVYAGRIAIFEGVLGGLN